MALVKSIMTPKVFSLGLKDTLLEAYEIMKTCQVTHIPVLEDKRVVGMVSRGDILLHATYHDKNLELSDVPITDIMSRSVVTCLPSATVANVAATMICCKIEAIPVVNVDGELSGIVTSTDLLDYLCMLEEEAGGNVMPFDFIERDLTARPTRVTLTRQRA